MHRFALPVLILALLPAAASAGEWVAGDLHVHTTYSHDSYGGPEDDNTGPEEAYTLGHSVQSQFSIAATRGLDFLAITDHQSVRSQTDEGFGFGGVIGVPGYENSIKGHAQMLGGKKDSYNRGDQSPGAINAMAGELRADGGLFQANHPVDPKWQYGYDVPIDTAEVWNAPWVYQPPFPSASDNDGALRFWHGWLDRGQRVAAVGGSDSHWVATTAAQGAGQPTTWVYVEQRTPEAILAGLEAGRTFVSHQPPNLGGPSAFLEADTDGDGTFESLVGDRVPRDSKLRVRVEGAPGAMLQLVTDGGEPAGDAVAIDSPSFTHTFDAPAGATWLHAQVYGEDLREQRSEAPCETFFSPDNPLGGTTYCGNRVLMLALTSALFLRDPDPDAPPEEEAPKPPVADPAPPASDPAAPAAVQEQPATTPRANAPAKPKAKKKAKAKKKKKAKRKKKRRVKRRPR
ncbi:MAG: PHP domain-containing protein [Thermoleophilaceae bacterium]|nr:PHP domain-containing protein [Thermoleophilaceae bacterium]